jgi:hypothetical protein
VEINKPMKTLRFWLLLFFLLKPVAFAAPGDGEAQVISNTKRLYDEIGAKLSPDVRIEQLGDLLRRIDSLELFKIHAEEAKLLRKKIQEDIATIPGHAEFFANKIKEEQERVKDIPLRSLPGRIEYNTRRYTYISKVLTNIPSPETIQVLGEFLWDEKDNQPVGPNDDWGAIEANANLAGLALSQIGLRNPPIETVFMGSPTEFQVWRTWYEEVKSGKRAFSFKGQNVEYRFNPDGSVSTTPIKVEEERPAPAPSKPEVIQQQPTTQVPTSTPAPVVEPTRWLWIIVGLIVAGLIALVTSSRKGKKPH